MLRRKERRGMKREEQRKLRGKGGRRNSVGFVRGERKGDGKKARGEQ